MILAFWMLSFKSAFSFSSFTFIKRFFRASLLSAIKVMPSAYLKLLIFLPAILTTACASFRPAFLMMYSAYKLIKQGDNIQPWYTPFPVLNQYVVPCPVLTVVSCPVNRFIRTQVRWSGIRDRGSVSIQFSSVTQSCPTLCNPMDYSTPGFPVHHQFPELAQTHAHQVGDAIQPSHPLFSSCLHLSQHQGLFQWVSSPHQVAKVLEFQLQHPSFQWIFRTIFFRIDWFELAVQGTLKSLLQHHSSKASIPQCSAFLIVQLSHPYMTTGKTTALARWTFFG